MNMDARNRNLQILQDRYFRAKSRKEKSSILDEYCQNTGQNRKYVIRKINSPIPSTPKKRKRKKEIYDGYVRAALKDVWEIFDRPCGQRLAPLLRTEVDRLRKFGELLVPDEVAEKLKRISPATIDRKLKRQKQALHLKRRYHGRRNPLIYQRIPIRCGDWDRTLIGQIQMDLVEHCGSSASGLFTNTVSSCEIATGWWEGEAVMGRGQQATHKAITRMRERTPFEWKAMHSDNDTAFINDQLERYAKAQGIKFSRSRPFKKNDNCFVERKLSPHKSHPWTPKV